MRRTTSEEAGGTSSTSVNLAGVLPAGTAYVVHNVLDFYGSPVASGTFGGSSVTLPLTGMTPPTPVGGWPSGVPSTGRDFHVFVIRPAGS